MTVLLWIAAGVLFTWLVVWALCGAAADGDRDLLAPHPDEDEQLADVARMCEYRHRRDVRNGLGRAS
jgi:hypothetical protein